MKNLSIAALLFMPPILHAEIKMEKPPSIEGYLAVENTIETPPAVEAPKPQLGRKSPIARPRHRPSDESVS